MLFTYFLLLLALPAHAGTVLETKKHVVEAAKEGAAQAQKSARPTQAFAPNEKDSATIAEVEKYLNAITTIAADFLQVAPDGGISEGKMLLQRPGRMRWEYAPPTPVLMVTQGKFLVFYDAELEQVTRVPLGSTLAGFLAKPRIRLDDPAVKLEKIERAAGAIRATLRQRETPEDGALMLEFSDAPLLLKNMVLTDAAGQVTTVSLSNATFGHAIDPKRFEFIDPRPLGRKRR